MTNDGGATWSKVLSPGHSATYELSSTSLAVVSNTCKALTIDTSQCPDELSLFRIGATVPFRTTDIPHLGSVIDLNAVALANVAPETIVVSEGSEGGGGGELVVLGRYDERWSIVAPS